MIPRYGVQARHSVEQKEVEAPKSTTYIDKPKTRRANSLLLNARSPSASESETSEGSNLSDEDFVYYQDPDDIDDYKDPILIENFEWKEIKKVDEKKWMPHYSPINGPTGISLDENSSPASFFQLFFSDEVIEDIRLWTNKRAEKTIDNVKRKQNKEKQWFAIRKENFEMEAFLGCLIAMGVNRMANIKQYWTTESRLFSNFGIKDLFVKKRFMDIFSNVCLRDPGTEDVKDPLGKIMPLVTRIMSTAQSIYSKERTLNR